MRRHWRAFVRRAIFCWAARSQWTTRETDRRPRPMPRRVVSSTKTGRSPPLGAYQTRRGFTVSPVRARIDHRVSTSAPRSQRAPSLVSRPHTRWRTTSRRAASASCAPASRRTRSRRRRSTRWPGSGGGSCGKCSARRAGAMSSPPCFSEAHHAWRSGAKDPAPNSVTSAPRATGSRPQRERPGRRRASRSASG